MAIDNATSADEALNVSVNNDEEVTFEALSGTTHYTAMTDAEPEIV